MLEMALPLYGLNLGYAERLLADVPDERMCDQPVQGQTMNHAAFVIGHLAYVSDVADTLIGAPAKVPAEWKDLFGMGAKPLAERSRYPAKQELLQALRDAHARLTAAVGSASADTLAQPAPERMRARFPSVGHVILGMMTSHEATHLGQLSAWRRALGMPSV